MRCAQASGHHNQKKKLKRNFREEGNKTHKFHLVKWKAITQPKSHGGLGIKDLTTQNESMLMKWLMEVLTGGSNPLEEGAEGKHGGVESKFLLS